MMWFYFQGELASETAVRISPLDQGLLYGVGLFNTFRTAKGRPLRLGAHRARLARGAERLGMVLAPQHLANPATTDEQWQEALSCLLEKEGLDDGVFRLILSAGSQGAGLPSGDYRSPVETLMVRPLPDAIPAEGISLHLLRQPHPPAECLPRIKSLSYLGNVLAWRELTTVRLAPGDEGLLADKAGFWVEGVTSNLFVMHDGVLITPPLSQGPLEGVMREAVIDCAIELGLGVEEAPVDHALLCRAHAVFMTNAVRGIMPVRQILSGEGRCVGACDSAHPELTRLQSAVETV